MTESQVSVGKYIGSFSVSYFLLLAVIGIAYQASGVMPPSSFNILVIMLTATGVALLFVRTHRRTFLPSEYRRLLLGSVAFDVALQIAPSFAMGRRLVLSTASFGMLLLVVAGHALVIAFAYKSWLVKRYAQHVATLSPRIPDPPQKSGKWGPSD